MGGTATEENIRGRPTQEHLQTGVGGDTDTDRQRHGLILKNNRQTDRDNNRERQKMEALTEPDRWRHGDMNRHIETQTDR